MTRRLRVGRHASPRQIRGHRPGTPGESARVLRPGHALSMRHASTAGRGNGLDSESACRAAPGPQATVDGTRHRAQVHAVAGRASLGVGHVALWGLREVAHRGWGAYHQPGCRRKAPARLDCSAFERRPYLHHSQDARGSERPSGLWPTNTTQLVQKRGVRETVKRRPL